MNLIKKNFIYLEFALLFLLIILLLISVGSFVIMQQGLVDPSTGSSSFEVIWMLIIGPGYFIFQLPFIGIISHFLLVALLLSVPVIGLLHHRKKWQQISLHVCLTIVILALIGFVWTAYSALSFFAGV